jgi:hypothetical protein
METVATTTALVAAFLNAAAATGGAWLWWRGDVRQWGWALVRTGQAGSVALAAVAGVAYASGARPDDGLFWLYALLPVPIGFFAEQFRLLSARTVLDARGLADAQAVGRLPPAEQRSIVAEIIRRELAVMAIAAAVVAFLALRAAALTGGI